MALTDHQDIAFGVTGQALYLDVPEGRPSSVTSVGVRRWDEGDNADARAATTGSASIDSVDTTFDAASGVSEADPYVANLADTASIAMDRQYLATAADGRKEWLPVDGIVSAASVRLALPMALDYVSGDTFEGTRISITVDATWVADAGNLNLGLEPFDRWRVRWEYVVAGVTYVRNTTFSLVRVPAGHRVQPADVDLRFPGLLATFPRDYRDHRAQRLIDQAYDSFRADLLHMRIPDEQVQAPVTVDEMTVLKTAVLVGQAKAMTGGDTITLEVAQGEYDRRFNQLFRSPTESPVPIGTDNTGAGDKRGAQPLTVR